MVPASVELKVYAGVVSVVGVVTAVTSASIGAVVSVVVVFFRSSPESLEQEIKIVKPIHETKKT